MEPDRPTDRGSPLGSQGPQGSRACDNCHARKIKCDRASPCSNCRVAQISCRTSPRLKEQRQRVLISHQYERKIEAIDERLSGIERMLRDLAVSIPARSTSGSDGPGTGDMPRIHIENPLPPSSVKSTPDEKTPEFEGDSSLSAYSIEASKLFEKTMGEIPQFEQNPEFAEALSSLKEMVSRQNAQSSSAQALRFSGQTENSTVDLSRLPLPPTEEVLTLLRLAKESTPFLFLSLPVMDVEHFTQMCKDLYFCTEDYSPSHFAIVNYILSYIFVEFTHFRSNDPSVAKFSEYGALCRSNFETAINTFSLFVEPTHYNVLSLALGAFHATECSKMSLAWNFMCAAARMCQTLGYHRSVAAPGDSQDLIQFKNQLFWLIYLIDRALSLCFGRSPTLQDYDITLPQPPLPADPSLRPWVVVYRCWIDYSKITGEIYEHLYSARALTGSGEARNQKAYELAEKVEAWRSGLPLDDISESMGPILVNWVAPSANFSYHTLLTLIYRVIPPSQPPETPSGLSLRCVDAARKALEIHQQFVHALAGRDDFMWKGYIEWTLLQCPFAPFMVLFCHIITASSLDDLKLLEEVSHSLQAASSVSEGGDRLYRLCIVFYRVAKLYVDAQLREFEQTQANLPAYSHPGIEFDSYLSALGVAPPLATPARTDGGKEGAENVGQYHVDTEMGQSLEGWFLGNQYMMNLLDPDI